MENKKYSAFVSSHFSSTKQERESIIRSLLNAQIFPFAMEYFTVTTNEDFRYIEKFIEQSDVFITILGNEYGSCDADGISWTQREFEYAQKLDIKSFVILDEKYIELERRYETGGELNDSEKKQVNFAKSISFAQKSNDKGLHLIMTQIISDIHNSNLIGWRRKDLSYEIKWQKEHRCLNLSGKWYHVHLMDSDDNYIRIGTVDINQKFNSDEYQNLSLSAYNYNVLRYDAQTDSLKINRTTRTVWNGKYSLNENGYIIGTYSARREFRENDYQVNEQVVNRGIHELNICDDDGDMDSSDVTTMIEGTFNDVAPSIKLGKLYLFRNKNDRINFLKDYHPNVLRSKSND